MRERQLYPKKIGILSLTEREDICQFIDKHEQPGKIELCKQILEYKDLRKFKAPKEWNAVILLHSVKLGRLSLTDVHEARYDKLLKDLYDDQDIMLIAIIAHDVNDCEGHFREEHLLNLECAQKSAFRYSSKYVIICDTLNKLHEEDSKLLAQFFRIAEKGEESEEKYAVDETKSDVKEEDEANQNEVSQVVLVTGACGFVASHIVEKLLEKGCRVRVTLRNSSSFEDSLKKWGDKLERFEADISETDRLKEIVRGCTHVIHTADSFPGDIMKKSGVKALLKACVDDGGVKRVIVTGSNDFAKGNIVNEPYSTGDWKKIDSTLKDAYWKALTETEALHFYERCQKAGQKKIELSFIRSPLVMGPIYFRVEDANVQMVRRLKDDMMAQDIHFPMCDVVDVAEAYIGALKFETAEGKCVDVTHQVLSLKEMRDIIRTKFDTNGKVFKIKLFSLGRIKNETTKALKKLYGDEKNYSHEKKCLLLWRSRIQLKTTVIEMVQSYSNHGLIDLKKSGTSGQDKAE